MANIFPTDFEEKLTMAQDDYILFSDSEDGNKIKKAQYKNLKGEKGDPGVNGTDGADGAAATITVGTTTTGAAGTSASVTNSGTSSAAVFNFTIPQGAKGETGADGKDGTDGKDGADGTSATITVGTTTTLPAGSSATVTNSGTSSAAVLNFGIPKGDKGDGSGDVNGPASSTDDNIATFDGATGKLIQDSGVSISDINTKTFTLSSTSDLVNAQAALDWYLNGGNPILYHERGYTNIPMPCTYHLRETRYRNSNYEYVFVSPAGNQDVDNLDWASENDTIFHCIGLSVADVNDEPGDTVLSIREFDIKGSDYFAKKADASKIEYVTQAEYTALLPGALTDNKHYFIYTESGGGWQPGANTVLYIPFSGNYNDQMGNTMTLVQGSGPTYSTTTAGEQYGIMPKDNSRITTSLTNLDINSWTVSVRLNWQEYYTFSSAAVVWGFGVGANDKGTGLLFGSEGSREMIIFVWGGDIHTGQYMPQSTWTHICMTQGSGTTTIYMNGQSIYTTSHTYVKNNDVFGIINNPVGFSDEYVGGIDEFIVEDVPRTATEILDYYNNTKANYGIS